MAEMQNIFGYICLNHSLSNLSISLIYFFWTPLMILVLPRSSFIHYFNAKIGQIGLLFWYISIYCHVFICINRFIAVYFPLKYNSFFSSVKTKIILIVLWIVAILHIIPYCFSTCDFYFDPDTYLFTFADTNCSYILGNVIDFRLTTIYVIMTISIDFLICVKLVLRFKKVINRNEIKRVKKKTTLSPFAVNKTMFKFTAIRKPTRKSQFKDTVTTGGSSYKPTLKTKFFFQAFCQNIIFLLEILSFYVFSTYFTTKMGIMVFTSCAWILCHILDGFCLMMFNKEIRRTITRCELYHN
uniref:G_PROTEIN_RECEP_F1_2 domain-containing protein n=1 Tax=Strongyloides venezuelensis TaxID=75913 RepID=A0A0K0FN49_STRVS